MFGLSFTGLFILVVLLLPLVFVIIGIVAFPIVVGTLIVKHKVLQHHS